MKWHTHLLKVSGLKVAYGGIQAVKGIDFEVREGELVSPDRRQRRRQDDHAEGHHRHASRWPPATSSSSASRIKGQGAWDLVSEGLVMVPEGRGIFTRMTITENLQIGAYIAQRQGRDRKDIDKVFATFPRLKERGTSWPAPCPAASSRCWRWAAR